MCLAFHPFRVGHLVLVVQVRHQFLSCHLFLAILVVHVSQYDLSDQEVQILFSHLFQGFRAYRGGLVALVDQDYLWDQLDLVFLVDLLALSRHNDLSVPFHPLFREDLGGQVVQVDIQCIHLVYDRLLRVLLQEHPVDHLPRLSHLGRFLLHLLEDLVGLQDIWLFCLRSLLKMKLFIKETYLFNWLDLARLKLQM